MYFLVVGVDEGDGGFFVQPWVYSVKGFSAVRGYLSFIFILPRLWIVLSVYLLVKFFLYCSFNLFLICCRKVVAIVLFSFLDFLMMTANTANLVSDCTLNEVLRLPFLFFYLAHTIKTK